MCSQSVPAALGRVQVWSVCGKPQGEVSGCMLHAPLYSVRVARQPLVWPAINRPQWRLKVWCGRIIPAFPLKMRAMLFILGRSFLQKERNGSVCRLESYVKHVVCSGSLTLPPSMMIYFVGILILLATLCAKYNQLLHKAFFYFLDLVFCSFRREHEYLNVIINL